MKPGAASSTRATGAGAWALSLALCLVWSVAARPAFASAPEPTLTRAPELVRFVEAEYPPEERAAGRAAVVKLRIEIDASGHVTSVDVIDSAGAAFDEAAVAAAERFEFTPAEVDGRPAPMAIEYEYSFAIAPPPQPPEGSTLRGVVVRRDDGQPLPGVRVQLRVEGEATPRTATTDAEGRFALDNLPAGSHPITVTGEGFAPAHTRETLPEGESLDVRWEIDLERATSPKQARDDLEILVVAPKQADEPLATRVDAEQARAVPGSSGDVVRVVESLPGVARSTAGSGQLLVWGAAPSETRVFVDGVPVPRLYHEGGLRSVVLPALVDTIDLVPGGQGAMWGRGLGGLVSVTTATPERERVGGRVAADVLDASALVSTPLDRRRRWHFAAGVRASYVAAWAERVVDDDSEGLVPLPSYGDAQVRVLGRPSGRDSIEIVAMASSDQSRRGVPDPDPGLAVEDRRALHFGRLYARYVRSADAVTFTATPWIGLGRRRLETAVGAAGTSLQVDDVVTGLRATWQWRPRPWLRVDSGVDVEVDASAIERVGSLGVPTREGDVRVFGQPPPDDLAADTWRVVRLGLAPWAQVTLSPLHGKLSIIPGIRVDPHARVVDRRSPPQAATPKVGLARHDFSVEPRLAIVGRPVERIELRAATGLHRQPPAPEDLSAAFGTPELPTAKSVHAAFGAEVAIVGDLSVDATGFFIRSRDLAMRSTADAPLPANALVPTGMGRSYGAQVLLRLRPWHGLFGWVAYTFTRSERRDHPDARFRLSDYDQTHVMSAVAAWALPHGFQIGARLRYATGFPRTPVVDAWYDVVRDRYQPIFGAHNSIRIPAFVQLDARLAKRFDIRETVLEVFLEVLNVWNRSNAEEIVYAPDYSRRGTISGFPILPSLGVKWEF